LNYENKADANTGYRNSDVINYYNPDKYNAPKAYSQSVAQIDPHNPTGLEPAPKDP
jgi:hypothetical protein